jgi:hypothetical protein
MHEQPPTLAERQRSPYSSRGTCASTGRTVLSRAPELSRRTRTSRSELVPSQMPVINPSPAEQAAGSLNELFIQTQRYRSGREFHDLLKFVRRFRSYALFNCMLLHIQRPGSTFVAPASRWRTQYGRAITPGQAPLVILQPMGPVMFVFDVAQTTPLANAPELPLDVEAPFAVTGAQAGAMWFWTVENGKRDGVRTSKQPTGSQAAGSIREFSGRASQRVTKRLRPTPEFLDISVRYDVYVSANLNVSASFATIIHELAHLYLGHLGTPNEKWWPDRRRESHVIREFEAEAVAWLVCSRNGIRPSSERYLATLIGSDNPIPEIDLDLVLKTARAIEEMTFGRLPLRKPN